MVYKSYCHMTHVSHDLVQRNVIVFNRLRKKKQFRFSLRHNNLETYKQNTACEISHNTL